MKTLVDRIREDIPFYEENGVWQSLSPEDIPKLLQAIEIYEKALEEYTDAKRYGFGAIVALKRVELILSMEGEHQKSVEVGCD